MNSTTLIVVAIVGIAALAYVASTTKPAAPTQTAAGSQPFTFGLSIPIK